MWARVIEVMLGCWLAVSPFIFRHAPEEKVLWFNDLFSAMAVIVFALLSFWAPMRFAHIVNLVIGLWLIAFGFWAVPYPTPPALQNDIVVGLLLVMFAIIPNDATRPPRAWRDLLTRSQENSVIKEPLAPLP